MPDQKKYIAHLDLDCFFVSVERINDPGLRGKPVAVGGSPKGRGVIASASYEARAFGVRSAMPTAKALRLCPQLVIVRGHHGEYSEYSNKLYKRILDFAPVVERASIDEMYMDFTGCEALYNNNLPGFMKTLQRLIWDEFSLPCTISLAANKAIAKIAAGTVKPAGVIYVPHGTEKEFLAPLAIDVIPGVGEKTGEFLKARGFCLVSDLQSITQKRATDLLGKHGVWIYNVAQGLGSQHLTTDWVRKSISNEETFAKDITNRHELEKELFSLVENVCSSLRSYRWKAKTITLKLRYSDFKTITRTASINPTSDDAIVFRTVQDLLHKAYARSLAIRLLGVGLSNFVEETEPELELFPSIKKRDQMLHAIDKIREKFGDDVIHAGGA